MSYILPVPSYYVMHPKLKQAIKFLVHCHGPRAKLTLSNLECISIAEMASNCRFDGDYHHEKRMIRLNFSRPISTLVLTLVHEVQHHLDSSEGSTSKWVPWDHPLEIYAWKAEQEFILEESQRV